MKGFLVELPVFVYTVENHHEIKDELLGLINTTQASPLVDSDDNIQMTDWETPSEIERPYYNKMVEVFHPALSEFRAAMNAKKVNLDNWWFQQYEKNGRHKWHVHPRSMYGMVYYVELPEKAQPTNIATNKGVVVPEAKEGDILFFPSVLFHSSPANEDAGRKTVLVGNINFTGANFE